MNKISICFLLAVVFLVPVSAGAVRSDDPDGSPSESRASRRIGGTYSAYPISNGQNFDLINVGVRNNLDIGCGGLDMKNALQAYFKVDYENILEYIKANALSSAVNYLIYENPTLYSLLQDLKSSADWSLNQRMLSCENIRQVADSKRKNADYYAEAKALCLQDGNTENQCSDDGKLENYLKAALAKREGRVNAATTSGSSTSGSATGGSNRPASLNALIVASLPLTDKDKALIGKNTGDTKLQNGNVQFEPPTSSISNELDKLTETNVQRLFTIFDAAANDKSFLANSNSPAMNEYKQLNREDGVQPISFETITRINSYSPSDRRYAIGRLARLIALSQMKSQIRREIMLNLNGLQSAKAKDELYPKELEERRQAISDLKLQMELIDSEFESIERQARFHSDLIDNAPAAKPVVR